jgi:hypothetical protein
MSRIADLSPDGLALIDIVSTPPSLHQHTCECVSCEPESFISEWVFRVLRAGGGRLLATVIVTSQLISPDTYSNTNRSYTNKKKGKEKNKKLFPSLNATESLAVDKPRILAQ